MSGFDYDRRTLWERTPWWIRWPVVIAIAVYFIGGTVAFLIAMQRAGGG